MSIACILFDLGNVLLLHHMQRRLAALAAFSGRTEKEAGELLVRSGIVERLDTGVADVATLCDVLGEFSGKPVPADTATEMWLTVFEPNRELWDILPRLAARHSLGVFSNNPPFVQTLFSPRVRFDHIFLSSQLGIMKPDMRAFQLVQSMLGLAPERVLFVDDKSDNVAQAQSIGWTAVQFRSNAEVIHDFTRLGIW